MSLTGVPAASAAVRKAFAAPRVGDIADALPSLIGLMTWFVSDFLQDGTLACWPWPKAVLAATAGGLILQTINFLFPAPYVEQ